MQMKQLPSPVALYVHPRVQFQPLPDHHNPGRDSELALASRAFPELMTHKICERERNGCCFKPLYLVICYTAIDYRHYPGGQCRFDIAEVGSILCWEDPLEESTTTHSSILAWRIP